MSDETGITIETVRGWLSTGLLGAILFMVARLGKPVVDFLLASRQLRLQEKKDDRQGYGDLIKILTDQVEQLTNQVSALSRENAQLRTEVRDLHNLLDGIRRGSLSESMSAQRVILRELGPERVSPELGRALDTLDGLPKDGE